MAVLKCKMCGGDIEVSQDMTVGKCLYCGSTMTLPKIESEKKARMFNRANEYRLNNEFDKAYDAYKTITEEDEQEAEAYWGMILSEYGVEYVEDPKTHKRIPTCHRTKIQSIQSSTNFNLACKYADSESRFIYQDEADALDKIQKRILAVSTKEEPYDVFICYKETDIETGERTEDSIIAQDIYNELTRDGLKVFFSRITLEDKLGQDYEPYIFAALNSARVMLVVTTSNENVNSVWVKNEWSRFIKFMQENPGKVLIPVYKGMEIYELPDELSKFQSQNFDKIGAMQDICHSVNKLVSIEEKQQKDNFINEYIQDKIKQEEENKKRIKKILIVLSISILLIGLLLAGGFVFRKKITYLQAKSFMNKGQYEQAIEKYNKIYDYSDSSAQIVECKYSYALKLIDLGYYDEAEEKLESISEKKDVSEDILNCRFQKAIALYNTGNFDEAENILINIQDSKDVTEELSQCRFKHATELYKEGSYEEARVLFSQVDTGSYKDEAIEYVYKCRYEIQMSMSYRYNNLGNFDEHLSEDMIYNMGVHMMDTRHYEDAAFFFSKCINYKDSIDLWKESEYLYAKTLQNDEKIKVLYKLGYGEMLSKIAPELSPKTLYYEPAIKDFEEIAEKYYNGLVSSINKSDWRKAKEILVYFYGVDYKDVNELKKIVNGPH